MKTYLVTVGNVIVPCLAINALQAVVEVLTGLGLQYIYTEFTVREYVK